MYYHYCFWATCLLMFTIIRSGLLIVSFYPLLWFTGLLCIGLNAHIVAQLKGLAATYQGDLTDLATSSQITFANLTEAQRELLTSLEFSLGLSLTMHSIDGGLVLNSGIDLSLPENNPLRLYVEIDLWAIIFALCVLVGIAWYVLYSLVKKRNRVEDTSLTTVLVMEPITSSEEPLITPA